MRRLVGAVLALAFSVVPAMASQDVADSVVKLHVTSEVPDHYRPWTFRQPSQSSGSGVVIDGQRILTNAHVVSHAAELLIESSKLPRRVPARVEALAYGIDLAIVRVDEPGFFDLHPPVELENTMPDDGSAVIVRGYPMGGSTLSTTEGVVSRLEYEQYWFGAMGLRLQIDAAVNPGNSGGPVFSEDRCIGLVFSQVPEGENIGYVIPVAEIEMFLEDFEDGVYDGKPNVWARTLNAENPALRAHLDVPITDGGTMVSVAPLGSKGELRERDVIVAVDGMPIDDRGRVEAFGRKINWEYAVQMTEGNTVDLTVIRDGDRITVSEPVMGYGQPLIPMLNNERPSYFVAGPLVFTEVTMDYAGFAVSGPWAGTFARRLSPITLRASDLRDFPEQRLVALANRPLSHPVVRGYDEAEIGLVLERVNGQKIDNLAGLVTIMRDLEDEYVVFEFADEVAERVLVFNREELGDATEDVMRRNSIRSAVSDDLADLWP
ncbi:MAG: trypsin-like peptidase domain-containing protein [Planctomycetota bacterium]